MQRELTHHQYLRSRLEEEFPDADEETLANTLEGRSNPPEMFADCGDLYSWHSDDLALDPHK